jgi:hypothetical protein
MNGPLTIRLPALPGQKSIVRRESLRVVGLAPIKAVTVDQPIISV